MYAGLPSTSEETKVLVPLTPPEVLHFKPAHELEAKQHTHHADFINHTSNALL